MKSSTYNLIGIMSISQQHWGLGIATEWWATKRRCPPYLALDSKKWASWSPKL